MSKITLKQWLDRMAWLFETAHHFDDDTVRLSGVLAKQIAEDASLFAKELPDE